MPGALEPGCRIRCWPICAGIWTPWRGRPRRSMCRRPARHASDRRSFFPACIGCTVASGVCIRFAHVRPCFVSGHSPRGIVSMCVLRPTRQKLTGRQSPHRFENEPSYRPSSLEAISSSASLFAQILRWVPPVYANVAWPPQTIGLRILDGEGREVFARQKANRRAGTTTRRHTTGSFSCPRKADRVDGARPMIRFSARRR